MTVFIVNGSVTASISGLTIQHDHATAFCSGSSCGGGIPNPIPVPRR